MMMIYSGLVAFESLVLCCSEPACNRYHHHHHHPVGMAFLQVWVPSRGADRLRVRQGWRHTQVACGSGATNTHIVVWTPCQSCSLPLCAASSQTAGRQAGRQSRCSTPDHTSVLAPLVLILHASRWWRPLLKSSILSCSQVGYAKGLDISQSEIEEAQRRFKELQDETQQRGAGAEFRVPTSWLWVLSATQLLAAWLWARA